VPLVVMEILIVDDVVPGELVCVDVCSWELV